MNGDPPNTYRNWAVGAAVLAPVLVVSALIFAFSAGRTNAESVTMFNQLVLLIAAITAFPLALFRSWVAYRQVETGQNQLAGYRRQLELAERGAEADRLEKNAALLHSDALAVRVAGISGLKSLATNPESALRIAAIEVIQSFLRSQAKTYEGERTPRSRCPEDIFVAFKAVMEAAESGLEVSPSPIDVYDLEMDGLTFPALGLDGITFTNCLFRHSSIKPANFLAFEECEFNRCEIHFERNDYSQIENCSFFDCEIKGAIGGGALASCTLYGCAMDELRITGGALAAEIFDSV